MSRATLIPSISMLQLELIEVTDDRLRPVSDAAVAAIATSIEEHGPDLSACRAAGQRPAL